MDLEFISVKYPAQRSVYMNGVKVGVTNTTIAVERGNHLISLGGGQDYSPAERIVSVSGTSPLEPLSVDFSPTDYPGPTVKK